MRVMCWIKRILIGFSRLDGRKFNFITETFSRQITYVKTRKLYHFQKKALRQVKIPLNSA